MKKNIVKYLLLSALLFLPLISCALDLIKIKSVNVKEIKEGIAIEITCDNPVTCRGFALEKPPRYAVNLYDVIVEKQETINIDKQLAKTVRIGQFQSKPKVVARAVVDLPEKNEAIVLSQEGNIVTISIYSKVITEQNVKETTILTTPVLTVDEAKKEPKVLALSVVQNTAIPEVTKTPAPVQTKAIVETAEVVKAAIPATEIPKIQNLPNTPVVATAPKVIEAVKTVEAPKAVETAKPIVTPKKNITEVEKPFVKVTVETVAPIVKPKEVISLDFRDAELSDVIWVLAKKAKINVIGREDLKGKVTIHLDSVNPKDALDMIMKVYGYSYEQQSENVFRIIRTEAKGREGKIEKSEKVFMTKSFIIKYAKASQIATTISKMLSADGIMQADDPSNMLIVIDTPMNVESIGKMIEELDLAPKQVLIEVKIAEISNSKGEDFRTIWNRVGQATQQVHANINLAEMRGTGLGITISTQDVDGLIEMLKSAADLNIVSTPQIVTLDNRTASIQVGSKVPYKMATTTSSGGILTTSEQIIYLDVGVVLSVTPHISGANSVIVDINPIISDYEYSPAVPGVPIITTRNLTSRVLIYDGQTLIVGGLMKDDIRESVYKVPLLGDIPLLGYLFKYSTKTKTKTNLVFFITPHILSK